MMSPKVSVFYPGIGQAAQNLAVAETGKFLGVFNFKKLNVVVIWAQVLPFQADVEPALFRFFIAAKSLHDGFLAGDRLHDLPLPGVQEVRQKGLAGKQEAIKKDQQIGQLLVFLQLQNMGKSCWPGACPSQEDPP